jgi:hypothetical protein
MFGAEGCQRYQSRRNDMGLKLLLATVGIAAAASPLSAARPEPAPAVAPAGSPDTLYCMKIEITGSRIEEVKCWTRQKWAEEEVDVDQEWPKEGVRVIA